MPNELDSSSPAEGRVDSFLGQDTPAAQDLQQSLANAPGQHPIAQALKTASWWATELIPGVAQQRAREKAAQAASQVHFQHAISMSVLQHAIGMAAHGDPSMLQSKELQKAAESVLGPMGMPLVHLLGTTAQNSYNNKTAVMGAYQTGLRNGMSPVDAAAQAMDLGRKAGATIPKELENAFVQGTAGPDIAQARQRAGTIGREGVELSPEVTAGKANQAAAVGAARTTASETARQPFVEQRGKEKEASQLRKEDRAQARELSKEERTEANKTLNEKNVKWGFLRPDGTIDAKQHPAPTHTGQSAAAAGYAPIDPKDPGTGWFSKLMGSAMGSTPSQTAPAPKKKTAAEQALDIINSP